MIMEPSKEDLEWGERVANQFTLSLIATCKAILLGNEEEWWMPIEHYVNMGFIAAEQELKIFLDPDRRKFVWNLVVSTLKKHYSELTNKGEDE